MATNGDDEHNVTIINLLLAKQEHEDSIEILREQQKEYQGQVNPKLVELEILWRTLERRAIDAKVQYLRHRQECLEDLRIKHEQIKIMMAQSEPFSSSSESSPVESH